jgi:hypothetical protein
MTHRSSPLAIVLVMMIANMLLTGCASSLVPFTHEIRTQHSLSDDDVHELQFYVSHEVTLRREVRTKGRTINGGNLKLHAGKLVEEIVIQEHTPGVAVAVDAETVRISFEEGSFLDFSIRTAAPQPLRTESRSSSSGFATSPDPFPGSSNDDEIVLLDAILDDGGNYWLDANNDAAIEFLGLEWTAVEKTFRAHLMIDAESLEEVVEERTTLKGRTIGKKKLPFIRL